MSEPDQVRRIADAVLYEGYILWPYRRSALKNQQRWTFGGVYPKEWAADHEDDASLMQTSCLVEGDESTRAEISVRFLQVVRRQPFAEREGGTEAVDELAVGAERHLAWEEAIEREVTMEAEELGRLAAPKEREIEVPAGVEEELVTGAGGDRIGHLERSWRELSGRITASATEVGDGLWRLAVRIENNSPFRAESRAEALEQTLCSCHTALHVSEGAFLSLTDPPERAAEQAARCENVGTWPVLVGEEGDRSTLLSSPIILSDYPEIAPESPGDLFDSSEIDQMLVLNILTLTDEEKREMRDSDPRAREILERTESLTPEELMRLHGTIREMSVVREGP
jgi:hypothetical protein